MQISYLYEEENHSLSTANSSNPKGTTIEMQIERTEAKKIGERINLFFASERQYYEMKLSYKKSQLVHKRLDSAFLQFR